VDRAQEVGTSAILEDPLRWNQHNRATARACGSTRSWKGKRGNLDLSKPRGAKKTYEKGPARRSTMICRAGMASALYITSSCSRKRDKGERRQRQQLLRGFAGDGKRWRRSSRFDFTKEKLGRAHHMKLAPRR